jgi:streptomycin 6-kinase
MSSFVINIKDVYRTNGEKWLWQLPEVIEEVILRLNLTELEPVPHLSYSYVALGFQQQRPIAIKISPDSNSLQNEIIALKSFSSYGTAEVLATGDNFLLMERALPGTPLMNHLPDRDKDLLPVMGKILQRLHSAPLPTSHHFPHLKDLLKSLDKDWPITTSLLEKARQLRDNLLTTAGPDVLLHTDLHGNNVLENKNHWLVIDPRPAIGDEIFDVTPFLHTPTNLIRRKDFSAIIQQRAGYFAELYGTTTQKIIGWSFVRAVSTWASAKKHHSCFAGYWQQLAEFFLGEMPTTTSPEKSPINSTPIATISQKTSIPSLVTG